MSRAQHSSAQGSTKMPSSKGTDDKANGSEGAKSVRGGAKSGVSKELQSNKKSRTKVTKGAGPADAANSSQTDVLAAGVFAAPSALIEMSQQIGDSGDLGRSFSARLRELRRTRALSLRKLGREVGVTANAVLRWEKDEVTPTRGKMLELSRYFDVEPAWLAWGIGARRNRLKPADLVEQLQRCDETQLRAVSALLEAFEPNQDI
ncbi:MAG: helix-turn-helix domain-containing protein [Proteobacteria bacterium]|nr:helix-turn-helix domain-containing protein [Pseudomonadota bacterium]